MCLTGTTIRTAQVRGRRNASALTSSGVGFLHTSPKCGQCAFANSHIVVSAEFMHFASLFYVSATDSETNMMSEACWSKFKVKILGRNLRITVRVGAAGVLELVQESYTDHKRKRNLGSHMINDFALPDA